MMCSRSSAHDVLTGIETIAQSGDIRQVAEALDAAKPHLFEGFQERQQHPIGAARKSGTIFRWQPGT